MAISGRLERISAPKLRPDTVAAARSQRFVGVVGVVVVLPLLELVVEQLGVVDDDAVERSVELL